jgi:predicted molibdopterin-dependent oxidoreductase YjgC
MTVVTTGAAGRSISLTIDGQAVCVPEGTTLLEACRMQGIVTPTLWVVLENSNVETLAS